MAGAGWDSSTGYAWDALSGKDLLDRNTRRADDLRAVINGAYADRPDRDILRNGPSRTVSTVSFCACGAQDRGELRSWFEEATDQTASATKVISQEICDSRTCVSWVRRLTS